MEEIYNLSIYNYIIKYSINDLYKITEELNLLEKRILNMIDDYKMFINQINQVINNIIDMDFLKNNP